MLDHPPSFENWVNTFLALWWGAMTQRMMITIKKKTMWRTMRTFWIKAQTEAPQMLTMKRTRTMANTKRVPCQAFGS